MRNYDIAIKIGCQALDVEGLQAETCKSPHTPPPASPCIAVLQKANIKLSVHKIKDLVAHEYYQSDSFVSSSNNQAPLPRLTTTYFISTFPLGKLSALAVCT